MSKPYIKLFNDFTAVLTQELFINHPFVKYTEKDNLVLFHYKEGCTYENLWDPVSRAARGIIFNKATRTLVARPWEKFYNIGQVPETRLDVLNTLGSFYVLDKLDGSMGILYKHEDKYYVTTKGSLISEQGEWATEWARKNLNFSTIDDNFTYVFEIIFSANKIVVDYGDFEGLVLTGVIKKEDGLELGPDELKDCATRLGVTCAELYKFESLDELVSYCKTLPASKEGFVITFPSTGLKVKVKGEEYLKIHRIISNLTPLAFYEAWSVEEKKIPDKYLISIPEEFRQYTDELSGIINQMHTDMEYEIVKEYDALLRYLQGADGNNVFGIREFAIECQKDHQANMSLLINVFKGEEGKMWKNIHKRVRPDGNVLPADYSTKFDIHGRVSRVIEDN